MAQGPRERGDGVVIVNFTPHVYSRGRVKVPLSGAWREVPNTDAAIYGGRDVRNAAGMETLTGSNHPRGHACCSTLCRNFPRPERALYGSLLAARTP